VKEGKKHAGPQLQKWARVAAQAKWNVSKGAGMPVLFRSKHARLNFDCHKQCKDKCTASGSVQDPERNPRHPQTSKLTYFCTLQSSYTRKGSKTGFCGNIDSWGAGSCLRAHIHIHHPEAALN